VSGAAAFSVSLLYIVAFRYDSVSSKQDPSVQATAAIARSDIIMRPRKINLFIPYFESLKITKILALYEFLMYYDLSPLTRSANLSSPLF
jgi:hypothetical protein